MAGQICLRRFERGAAGVQDDVEVCVDAFEPYPDHLADPAADAVAVVRFADGAWDGKAETGSRRPGPLFTGLGA